MNLAVGMKHTIKCVVDKDMTALAVGSGSLEVFSTPSLLALMEAAAFELAQQGVDKGYTTVGSAVDLHHVSPTPVGLTVMAEARITAMLNRKITFKITAFDKEGIIGEATHDRIIVDAAAFKRSCDAKL